MKGIIKEKSFYRAMLAMMIPIALQNVISTGVGIMDTVMLGSFGDATLSGASLGNQPAFMLTVVVCGIASGAGVLISQYVGRGNNDAAGRVIAISMKFVILLASVIMGVCFFFPEFVISIFNFESDVITAGSDYLRIVTLSYIPAAVTTCYMVSLRATGKPVFATMVYAVSFFVNIFFNYCFIFGALGFPRLEVVGAAVGTVIARFFELGCVIVHTLFFQKGVIFRWSGLFRHEKQLTADFFKTALPVTGSEFLWSLGSLATTVIIGNLGKVFVTATSVANIIQQLGMVMMFGVANAAAVLVGKSAGQGDFDRAYAISRTMLVISLGVGVIACSMVMLLRTPFLSIYNISPEAADIAYNIMGIMGLLLLIGGMEITSIIGILRGAGDTRFAFFVDTCCMWLVSVPMGVLAGYVLLLPPVIVYIFIRSDLPLRLVLCLTRILKGKFIKNVTRDQI